MVTVKVIYKSGRHESLSFKSKKEAEDAALKLSKMDTVFYVSEVKK